MALSLINYFFLEIEVRESRGAGKRRKLAPKTEKKKASQNGFHSLTLHRPCPFSTNRKLAFH